MISNSAQFKLNLRLPSSTNWRSLVYGTELRRYKEFIFTKERSAFFYKKYKHVVTAEEKDEFTRTCGKLEKETKDKCVDDTLVPIDWTHEDLLYTSELLKISEKMLTKTSLPGKSLEQTRRIYSLMFDILRFKPVLVEALVDIDFFKIHPQFDSCPWNIWLLGYDLYKREFERRKMMDTLIYLHFKEEGLADIDNALWEHRVKFAAAISRLRIKSGAYYLEELLPQHLQISQKTLTGPIIGGWINTFQVEKVEFFEKIKTEFTNEEVKEDGDDIHTIIVKDHVVPRYVHFYKKNREDILTSDLIAKRHFIIQDRSLCLGAVMFLKIMEKLELCGSVAQTHIVTPPSTAYFASMIANNPNIDQLLIFSTGQRKTEYEEYFQDIGAFNVSIFSEEFSDIAPENRVLHNVIAVMACPPSSNTAVSNPVDVAISRGGDFTIMYALTEHYNSEDIDEHILMIQKNTLLKAMSMPQIQAVVYETHSRSTSENTKMVNLAVHEINQWAADKHYEQNQGASPQFVEQENQEAHPLDDSASQGTVSEEIYIQVPLCDLYEVSCLPDFCPDEADCIQLSNEGIYLALLKRKEVTRLDPTYMINMAEARGLFGRQIDTAAVKATKKKLMKTFSFSLQETKQIRPKVEIDRLAAPTLSSQQRDIKIDHKSLFCERHYKHLNADQYEHPPLARVWWKALLLHIKKYLHCKTRFPKLKLNRPIKVIKTAPPKLSYPTRIAKVKFCATLECECS